MEYRVDAFTYTWVACSQWTRSPVPNVHTARICVHKRSSATVFVFRIFSIFIYLNAIANAMQMRRLLELNCCAASALCPLNELIYENISFRLHVWSCFGFVVVVAAAAVVGCGCSLVCRWLCLYRSEILFAFGFAFCRHDRCAHRFFLCSYLVFLASYRISVFMPEYTNAAHDWDKRLRRCEQQMTHIWLCLCATHTHTHTKRAPAVQNSCRFFPSASFRSSFVCVSRVASICNRLN